MDRTRIDVSVVIPVVDEEASIGSCLGQFEGLDGVEVIVADGGSSDGTEDRVRECAYARWVKSPAPGRGPQMNAGAQSAEGGVLLFLHADSRLPDDGIDRIRAAIADEGVVGGRFELALSERTFVFDLIARLSTLRSKYLGITYGDQGIFVRRSAFDAVGGYPDRMIFEDSELCDRLRRQGRFVLLDAAVVSSTRRWREWGTLRTVFRMWALRALYRLGVADERLARWYRTVR